MPGHSSVVAVAVDSLQKGNTRGTRPAVPILAIGVVVVVLGAFAAVRSSIPTPRS